MYPNITLAALEQILTNQCLMLENQAALLAGQATTNRKLDELMTVSEEFAALGTKYEADVAKLIDVLKSQNDLIIAANDSADKAAAALVDAKAQLVASGVDQSVVDAFSATEGHLADVIAGTVPVVIPTPTPLVPSTIPTGDVPPSTTPVADGGNAL